MISLNYFSNILSKNTLGSALSEAFTRQPQPDNILTIPPLTAPTKTATHSFADDLIDYLFPLNSQLPGPIQLLSLKRQLKHLLNTLAVDTPQVSKAFFAVLPAVYETLLADAQAVLAFDPAATSLEEVIAAYPGFYATAIYRLAHELVRLEVPLLPRMLTEYAHSRTGIDIHPAARIGRAFVIDHGTGVVIGATTRIGNQVTLYHGVTLGALQVNKSLANSKRHPTIEDHVTIYANATVLGGETVVGHHSILGGNIWLTQSVPPHSRVYYEGKINLRLPSEK